MSTSEKPPTEHMVIIGAIVASLRWELFPNTTTVPRIVSIQPIEEMQPWSFMGRIHHHSSHVLSRQFLIPH